MPRRILSRTKSVMMLAFAVIVVCLSTVGFVEYVQAMKTRSAIAGIQQNALVSVELLHRIGDDIHAEQLLLDAHVFEHELGTMQRIEKRIASIREDFDAAARSYEALPAPPNEMVVWRQLTSDVEAARLRVAPVLALSRADRASDAVRALEQLDPLFLKISSNEALLDRINSAETHLAVADVRHIQATALEVRLALLGIVLLTVVLVGRWTSRSALSAEQQLTNLNEALAERNRDLDAFAGRLAHDLRSPLSTIGLASSSLAERYPDAGPTTALMERSITQISNLMDELLTLSRLGTMLNASARAESVAAALHARLDPLIAEVGGSLHIDLQPGSIACSESLLSQVLWNLAENSVKYRQPDVAPRISIEGRVDDGQYRIRASDNGMGMSESDARHAFEPFFRGKHQKIPGTGLGLSIVRRIIEATHGTITVQSRIGEGTTFIVSIPLAKADDAERAEVQIGAEPIPVT